MLDHVYRCRCGGIALPGFLRCRRCQFCHCRDPIPLRSYGGRWTCARCGRTESFKRGAWRRLEPV